MVNDALWGEGIDQSIKAAEQIAAENAYKTRVIPAMERKSKKGYRDPLPDETPVSVPESVSKESLCTITASLDFIETKEKLEVFAAEPAPEWMPPQAQPEEVLELPQGNEKTENPDSPDDLKQAEQASPKKKRTTTARSKAKTTEKQTKTTDKTKKTKEKKSE